ncbi:MAG: c-type cytochrome, partial [Gammaproteobacteria bacterium]
MPPLRIPRTSAAILALLLAASAAGEPRVSPSELAAAEALYRQGILPSGQPLRAERQRAEPLEGAAAACVNCHRRSGFGTEEGRIVIPPINGKYLFRDSSVETAQMAHPGGEAASPRRSRYTDQSLARAIRSGLDPDGRSLDYLMPRYQLDDATMASLIAYLKQLSSHPVPGATGDILEFATIVTPDADPVKRDGMLDVLNHFFDNKNAFYRGQDPPLQSSRRIHFRVLRRWQLHVWQLSGPPQTWEAQLQQRFKAEPVFAVISGIGGKTWAPVHRFCEKQSLPCLMPNVELPVVAEKDFYPLYFSRGVLLEADVVANRLSAAADRAMPPRVVQVLRPDDIGVAAAKELAAALAPLGAKITTHELKSKQAAQELAEVARDAAAADALVLWLRPDDLQALPVSGSAPAPKSVFVSGLMGRLENAPLPASWRGVTRMTYPFDLPQQRVIRMNYPLGWFTIQHIPVVDERTQADTYLACSILAEAASNMLDNFVPDYLIERVEVQLSHRIINGYYP